MNQRGRKSAASLAVVDDSQSAFGSVMPPPMLSPAERVAWQGIVGSKPMDWFGMEHVPMLVVLVKHICQATVIDEQIKAFDPEWMATDEGLRRYEKLIGMSAKVAGVINTLMRSMRLTHQAIYRKDKAGMGPGKGRKLWQREAS